MSPAHRPDIAEAHINKLTLSADDGWAQTHPFDFPVNPEGRIQDDIPAAEASKTRISRLQAPAGKVRMVLDTDTYNEIDDQFALTYALLSPDKLSVEAIYAAPFHNSRSNGPGDGMEKSYEEILRLLEFLGRSAHGFAYRGSTEYLGY